MYVMWEYDNCEACDATQHKASSYLINRSKTAILQLKASQQYFSDEVSREF